jgi:hypothetical protein
MRSTLDRPTAAPAGRRQVEDLRDLDIFATP